MIFTALLTIIFAYTPLDRYAPEELSTNSHLTIIEEKIDAMLEKLEGIEEYLYEPTEKITVDPLNPFPEYVPESFNQED